MDIFFHVTSHDFFLCIHLAKNVLLKGCQLDWIRANSNGLILNGVEKSWLDWDTEQQQAL